MKITISILLMVLGTTLTGLGIRFESEYHAKSKKSKYFFAFGGLFLFTCYILV